MSFVKTYIFFEGLLDGKGYILDTINKCLGNCVIFVIFFHISKRMNEYPGGNNI